MYRLVVLGLLLLVPDIAPAPEKWADNSVKLPATPILWLDAARQKAAYAAHGRTLVDGAVLDVWYDASGDGRHLTQRAQAMQPRFVESAGVGLVRFTGQEYLGRVAKEDPLEDCTLFLVTVPRSNKGDFRAWLALSELGKNDYHTGLNVDQNHAASGRLAQINVEGRGFGGAVNLMRGAEAFGKLRRIRIEAGRGKDGVKLFVDGEPHGQRPRTPGAIAMDTITLGARYYSNTGEPAYVQGFLDGDIAEIILYARLLGTDETRDVESYLEKKYAALARDLESGRDQGYVLRPIDNPPPVQMLVPGFTVRELPVDLPNINNVRYRHDGKLVALGYNGNVHLLSDKDGDGLEDTAQVFWENKTGLRGPIGIVLTPKSYAKGQGLFVASKGKVSLIVDTDGDDRGDQEIIVAQGWKEIPQAVDALGMAMDKDGNLYFGLGTTDYSNAYLKTKDGKALFDIKSERGTIQKLAADFKKRETVCTGIRFPVGIAFNRHGDLFCSDQEGATWLPNGNPFDELLHIEPGRHYGFPPRHPKILPNVIDEPSVFDYGPQHQSTCGLFFNEPVNGGPTFGPAAWAGDALICGESRGKLYRTRLVKTRHGYIAQNHLIACLQMLTVDACVSPRGDLIVACHSGPPDWGTGPQGKGKLYRISYTDHKAPQPLFAYAAGPREVRIAFDKPLEFDYLKSLSAKVKVEYGPYVRPGDRFETLRPPYAIVKQQLATPRRELAVLGVSVTPDRRTLLVTTARHVAPVSYALTMPAPQSSRLAPRDDVRSRSERTTFQTIDLGYDLSGVQADWLAQDGQKASVWLPHMDLEVARAWTAGSAEHEPFWKMLEKPGRLTFHTNLDLWNMLRPAIQPGSTLDYELPREQINLKLESAGQMVSTNGLPGKYKITGSPTGWGYDIAVQADKDADARLDWTVAAEKRMSYFHASFSTNEDPRPRALPLRRLSLPWVARKPAAVAATTNRDHPELRGGNWLRGRAIYDGDKAKCSQCHQVRGQGGRIGPDLSNLVHRDYESVLRDIRLPSAALNPDYLSYVLNLKDGRSLTGSLRSDGDQLWVGTAEGKEIAIARGDIEALAPSAVSVMPEGLDKNLSADELRDLMTFLLTEPMQPAPLERKGAPPPRKKAEVDKVLGQAARDPGPFQKIHIVLAAGPKDHGPGEHDYPLWQRRWLNLFGMAPNVMVSTADGWPSPKQWQTADLIVFYSAGAGFSAERAKDFDAHLARGGGLAYIHWAIEGRKDAGVLAQRIGLASNSGRTKYRHGPLEMTFTADHSITRGFDKVQFVDESYWNLVGDPAKITVLASCVEDGQPRPQIWTRQVGQGRVFVNILGHYTWTFDDPLFRILQLRGMAWAARQPVERWTDLATVGARLDD